MITRGLRSQPPILSLNPHQVIVRKLGKVDYRETCTGMQEFTKTRTGETVDEFWILQHDPVYTQGYSCSQRPFLHTSIPVVATDRGGQITYHGPGQLIIYLLLDIKRRNQGVRHFVQAIESAIIATLRRYRIEGQTKVKAPGVYVGEKKIASLGIRVSRGCTYHGLSLNVDLDTEPFRAIDVCGIKDLEVTTMRMLNGNCDMNEVQTHCAEELARQLGYRNIAYI